VLLKIIGLKVFCFIVIGLYLIGYFFYIGFYILIYYYFLLFLIYYGFATTARLPFKLKPPNFNLSVVNGLAAESFIYILVPSLLFLLLNEN
jgi:hypothetical protein